MAVCAGSALALHIWYDPQPVFPAVRPIHCTCSQPILLLMQVPLHVGAGLTAAVQYNWNSPGTGAALCVLETLLGTAIVSGLITDGAAGTLAISMRQQLQQAGVLQQLATVMAALAADLHSEAAALAGQSEDELCAQFSRPSVANINEPHRQAPLLDLIRRLLQALMMLWSSPDQTVSVRCHSWLCDPSGHAEAAMQLSTAALQHGSSVLQHVLPAVQERMPQQAAALLQELQGRTTAALALSESLAVLLSDAQQYTTAAQGAQAQQRAQQLQRLLLSPPCLPFAATLLALKTTWFSLTAKQLAASGSRGVADSSAALQAGFSNSSTGSSTGSSDSVGSDATTPCQLRLFEVLGLHPQLTAWVEQQHSPSQAAPPLGAVANTVQAYHQTTLDVFFRDGERERENQPARWQFEQQVWLLLPSVLLPCANSLLMLADGTIRDPSQQRQGLIKLEEHLASVFHDLSCRALNAASVLSCWLDGGPSNHRQADPAWAGELLGGVLQLADKLLQQLHAEPLAAAAAAAGSNQGSSSKQGALVSCHGSSCSTGTILWQAERAREIVGLLARLVRDSSTASQQGQSSSSSVHAALVRQTPPVPPVADRFCEVCTALEAALRAVATAQQRGIGDHTTRLGFSMYVLFFEEAAFTGSDSEGGGSNGGGSNGGGSNGGGSNGGGSNGGGSDGGGSDESGGDEGRQSALTVHLGMCGPASLVRELRQYYSVLSTVQKLGQCKAGVALELCFGQCVSNMCCWAAAHTSVGLLQTGAPTAGSAPAAAAGDQAQSTSVAMVQLAEVEYLPSLVILGRCCLAWAEQLQQQSPELLQLIASGAAVPHLQQGEEGEEFTIMIGQGGVQVEHSAARVCVPGWQEGAAAAGGEPCGLEDLVATVSLWVGGITSPVADATLAAAGGGSIQQFRQQLEALSAGQQVARAGVSDASLAALVQQLQATGVMLSGIAVPHFCNNTGCMNISAPTEMQLVSGRSCICAGCCIARYCGRVCQRQAWPRHKPVCKALAAAAAGTQL